MLKHLNDIGGFFGGVGGFVGGVAAILTVLYGQALFRDSPVLPAFKQDVPEQPLHDELRKARTELKLATEARASLEADLRTRNSQAQLLEMSLRDKNSLVEQLEAVVRERNSRIQQLESERPGQPRGPRVGPPRQQDLRLLETDVVRVSLTRIERTGERMYLVLAVENIDKDEIRIDLKNHTIRLIDDRGEQWKLGEITGLVGNSLVLPPGGKQTSRLTFTLKGSGGMTFDFVGSVILFRGGRATEQTIAFNNLQAQ